METSDLSVKACAVETINLPFRNLREFLRFSCVPIALTVPLQLVSLYIWYHVSKRPIINLLLNPLQVIIGVPFAVAWVRLAANGPGSVARRDLYPFGRVERNLLLTQFALTLAVAFIMFLSAIAIIASVNYFHTQSVFLTIALFVLGVALVVLMIILFARLALMLVAVALQRYDGIRGCLRLSKGIGFRTVAIVVLAILPYSLGQGVAGAIQHYTSDSWVCTLPAVGYVIFEYLSTAAYFGGLAVIYKSIAASEPVPQGDLASQV